MQLQTQSLAPPSRPVAGHQQAAAFARQLQERHEAAQKAGVTQTDVTQLPFRIQMEVKGESTNLGRLLTASGVPWTAQSSRGD